MYNEEKKNGTCAGRKVVEVRMWLMGFYNFYGVRKQFLAGS